MSKEKQSNLEERLSVATGEGLLTESDLSQLLDLSVATIVRYIDSGRLPGTKIGPQGSRLRTLTSVKQLIARVEQESVNG